MGRLFYLLLAVNSAITLNSLQSAVIQSIPFAKTGILPSITLDYLVHPERLAPYYNRYFSKEDFYRQILEKQQEFTDERRKILYRALKRQYSEQGIVLSASEPVMTNIELLSRNDTFTITTGHQLCLHTGPLYFLYKILSAIAQVRKLKVWYPEYHFVPVFWMASEDHDFQEINHFHHHRVRFHWNYKHSGQPVGRLSLEGYRELLQTYSEFLMPHNSSITEWLKILEYSYLTSINLAQATRKLVHQLLGHYGIVIIDGDDPELKNAFRLIIKDEVLRQVSNEPLKETSEEIGRLWFAQVNPRDINFFYLGDSRVRIEKASDGTYRAGQRVWSTRELEREIDNRPENFSPNVVTRPLYQEFVLPNLAYIGGANEIAYWLQLKGVFTTHQIPMPILLLRNSFLQLNAKVKRILEKNDLLEEILFQPPAKVVKDLIRKTSPTDSRFEHFSSQMKKLYAEIEEYSANVDKTLAASARARMVRHLKAIESLKAKVLSAEARKNDQLLRKLQEIHHMVYPNGVLQERYENVSQYYCKYGQDWIDVLMAEADMPSTNAIVLYWPD